jgi:hypothetical protein
MMACGILLSNRKNTKNHVFFWIFASFSLIIFYFFLQESKLLELHIYIATICLSGMFLIGPSIYFLTLFTLDSSFRLNKKYHFHFLPAAFSIIIGLLSVLIWGYKQYYFLFDYFGNIITIIIGIFGSLSFLLYVIIAAKKLIKSYLWNFKNLKNEPSAIACFLIFDIFLTGSVTDTLMILREIYFICISRCFYYHLV